MPAVDGDREDPGQRRRGGGLPEAPVDQLTDRRLDVLVAQDCGDAGHRRSDAAPDLAGLPWLVQPRRCRDSYGLEAADVGGAQTPGWCREAAHGLETHLCGRRRELAGICGSVETG